MQVTFIVVLCNIFPVLLAQILLNEDLGDFHFKAMVGNLPSKYYPLTQKDLQASEKARDVVDFIQLVPNIDPLKRAALKPLGIDVSFLWLSGTVAMKNIALAGIKQLEVHAVELRLNNLRTDLNISIPLIYFEGEFHLQAYFGFIPLKFSCHISANLMDVDVSVSSGSKAIQAPPVGEVLQVTSAAVHLDIRNVQLNITNPVIGGSQEDVGNAVTQLFSGPARRNIFNGMLESVLEMVNQKLLDVSTDVFKSYLLSDSS